MARKKSEPVTTAGAARPKKGSPGSKSAWKMLDRASTIGGGLVATQISRAAWRAAVGRKPPVTGRHPEVETREAVAWAIVGGALVELTKVGARRWTANYWVRSTGSLPPGMKSIRPDGKKAEAAKQRPPAASR